MSRIAHSVPMAAYDHVARILEQAGGKDGVISRADAEKLVDDLRKAGKGTEAQAAENIFKFIDARDARPGARVTGYDLNLTRGYVQEKLLENRDLNRNGYSRAEIEKMSPTGRALVELGQILEIEAVKGRTAHAVPEKGLEHVAGLLKAAAGKDGVTSRADIDALGDALYHAGRGTEGLAVRYFAGFIDHRDAAPGARITTADIDKAVSYAKEHLLQNKDKNRNGYSAAEVEKFSTSAKAMLLIGQMIDAGIIKGGIELPEAKPSRPAGAPISQPPAVQKDLEGTDNA